MPDRNPMHDAMVEVGTELFKRDKEARKNHKADWDEEKVSPAEWNELVQRNVEYRQQEMSRFKAEYGDESIPGKKKSGADMFLEKYGRGKRT